MALLHPFVSEAIPELGPDIFRCIDKDGPLVLYHVFNIYYGLEIKRKIQVMMAEMCEANGFGCHCDIYNSITDAFYCWGWKAMEAIANDPDSQATITFSMKEHCEEIRLQDMNVDAFLCDTKPFCPGLVKDEWLNDLLYVLENHVTWIISKH